MGLSSTFRETISAKLAAHRLNCDYCRSHLVGARIICLNCQFKEKFAIFRLCNLPKRCMEHRVVREDLERPHLPTHDLVKIRRRIHARQFSGMSTEAMEALATAKSLLSSDPISIDEDSAESEDEGSSHEATSDTVGEVGTANTSKFVCAGCGKDIIQPVWFCVHCSGMYPELELDVFLNITKQILPGSVLNATRTAHQNYRIVLMVKIMILSASSSRLSTST